MKYKGLFLDRDGIINIDHGHVGTIDRLDLIDKTLHICKKAQDKNYKIVIITNQAGIAKGYFSLEDFLKLTQYIDSIYKNYSINLIFYFCPYHEEAIHFKYRIDNNLQKELQPSKKAINIKNNVFQSHYRKPNPGMILQAAEHFNINLANSIFIGDKDTDMQAAKLAGINSRIIISVKPHNNFKLATTQLPDIDKNLIKYLSPHI